MADQITTSLAQAKVLVMQGMAGKAPRINAANSHWEVWDNDMQAWVDTGVSAAGKAGHSPRIDVSETSNGVILTIDNGQSGDEAVEACFIRDGEQGAPGPQGPQGPAGSDYVLTTADKQEIAALVIQMLSLEPEVTDK